MCQACRRYSHQHVFFTFASDNYRQIQQQRKTDQVTSGVMSVSSMSYFSLVLEISPNKYRKLIVCK